MYAEPELAIIAAISENDKLARKATIPAITKDMIIDRPEYFTAACPLKTKIPMPEKIINDYYVIYLFNINLIHR